MDRGRKGAAVCGGGVEEERGTFPEFASGDGVPQMCGGSCEMDRGPPYKPCSARNRARIFRARWRPASISSGVGGGAATEGARGLGGLGGA